jgi:hypothetical protein
MRRTVLGLLTGVLVLVLWAQPAGAQAAGDDDALVVLTGRAEVAAEEDVETVVIFDGPATIDGTVREQVVAFNGDVLVNGVVEDDVVAFNGRVTVAGQGAVGGDVVSRESAVVEEGATVTGDVRRFDPDVFDTWFGVVTRLAWWLTVTVAVLVLGLLLVWLAPRAAAATFTAARTATGPTVAWGIAALVGGPIVAVLIMVTVIGIPLGLYLLAALGVISVVGYTAAAWVLGRSIVREPVGRVPAFLAGLGILRLAALIPLLGSLVWFLAAVFGTGALLVAAWRARSATAAASWQEPVPAQP